MIQKKTTLAIVGRPNVGKSALFNRICQKRKAIVDDEEGVTRDRLYGDADFYGRPFQVIDTGGIRLYGDAPFTDEIRVQAEIAIAEADTIVMVVDSRVGVTDLDINLARMLLRTNKPLCLAVNKIDSEKQEETLHQFYSLGIEKILPVSAAQGTNISELLEMALETIPIASPVTEEQGTCIAIVGRPNVGKSSLVNALLNEPRCVVSPIPGTTRDSIDIPFTYDEKHYILLDTAGIRRKHKEHETVDKFAFIRTENAIENASICLLMLDISAGITAQDKRIASLIEEKGKGCVVLCNKWDLVKGVQMEDCLRGIHNEAPFLKYCPKIFLSAKTGRNLQDIFPIVQQVLAETEKRITTGQLNKTIEKAIQKSHPPMIQGKRLRIYYTTQVNSLPPTFVLFVNYPHLMQGSYMRYLLNQLREEYSFTGLPIQMFMKGKSSVNPYDPKDVTHK